MRVEGDRGKTQVLLVEDHASFRQALAFLLETEPGFVVAAQAGSLAEAREVIGSPEELHVAVVDLALPDGDGVDLIRDLTASRPETAVLVLSASLDRARFAQAVEAGAAGMLHKAAAINEIVSAVKQLQNGEALISPNEVIEMLRMASRSRQREHEVRLSVESLTPRELEVLEALTEGLDSKEIARKLHITIETERNHAKSIMRKLGVHSRLQAVLFAARHGIVEIH